MNKMTKDEAIKHLLDTFNIEDRIYDVRERVTDMELDRIPEDLHEEVILWLKDWKASSWDHPMVLLYAECIQVLKNNV